MKIIGIVIVAIITYYVLFSIKKKSIKIDDSGDKETDDDIDIKDGDDNPIEL